MTITTDLSDLLRTLDPARTSAPLDPAVGARAQALLDRTLALPASGAGTPSPRRGRSPRRLVAAGVAAAAVATAAVLAPAYIGGAEATAWSAIPTATADIAAERSCAAEVRSMRVPDEMGPVDLSRMMPVLSDVRGPVVLVYLTDGVSELSCYVEDGQAGLAGSMANVGARPTVVPRGSVRCSGGSITRTGIGMVRAVTGTVGDGVVSVVLDTVAQGPVTATVVDRHFAAWWPDEHVTDAAEDRAGPGDELRGVTVTLRDGSVRDVPVETLLGQ
jgi:hypothetical protein